MRIKNYKMVFLGIIYLLLTSCGKSNVEIVKGGTLPFDKSITIGNGLNNYKYFKSVKWQEVQDENKRNYVVFTGDINIDKLKEFDQYNAQYIEKMEYAMIIITFLVNIDKTVAISGFNYAFKHKEDNILVRYGPDDYSEMASWIRSLYNNDQKSGEYLSGYLRIAYLLHYKSL
jgi:hypothetical protein